MSAYLSKYVVTLKSIRTMDNFFNDDELVIKFQIVVTASYCCCTSTSTQNDVTYDIYIIWTSHILSLYL